MIGSRAKCHTILEHLINNCHTNKQLTSVYAPIGLDLGGPSSEEIAVAIMAEVIAVRSGSAGECDRVRKTSLLNNDKWP